VTTQTTTTTLDEESEEEKQQKDELDLLENATKINLTDASECFEKGVVYHGIPEGPEKWPYVGYVWVYNVEECHQECVKHEKCKFFVYHGWKCFLKQSRASTAYRLTSGWGSEWVSGRKECPEDPALRGHASTPRRPPWFVALVAGALALLAAGL